MRERTKRYTEVLTIGLKIDALKAAAQGRGWITELQIAQGVGFSPASVNRLLGDKQDPGSQFIAAVLDAFPDRDFEDFFEIVQDAAALARRAS